MTNEFKPDRDPASAREALRDVQTASAGAARRIPARPWWFEAAWMAIIAGLVLSIAAPLPFNLLLIAGLIWVLGRIVVLYQKRYGVWVSGYRAGRTRIVAIVLTAIIMAIMLGVWIARYFFGVIWIAPVGAAAAAGVGFIFGRLWMAAYRAETGARA